MRTKKNKRRAIRKQMRGGLRVPAMPTRPAAFMTRRGLGWEELNKIADRPWREIVAALVAVVATLAWAALLYLFG